MVDLLTQTLSELGYECETASNGAAGLRKARGCDLILADVMMPVMNGFTMVETLRAGGSRIPVIYLTAKDTTKDVVRGLELGADDYLVKPFVLDELIARVRATLRRAADTSQIVKWNDITLDRTNRLARRSGAELFLSATEFLLLDCFMCHPEVVLSRSLLLEKVWRDEGYRAENIVETYVTYLRRKTEAYGASRIIHTVRGSGYVLALSEPES
ncbi:MAG: response regulator transcription factor [Armatimonadetes bacterium]|nr:response regulator transcription factor [Armatimonadota bacterium]